MTQPQYGYPPQQGGYPDPNAGQYGAPQGYVQQPPPYQPAPPQQYGPPQGQPNMYGPPPGQQGYGYAPQQPAPGPDLSGDLESFYAQRSVGGGKGISWKGVPDGFTVLGVVARTIGHGDVFKETHPPGSPMAGQLRLNRDNSPKYAMQVPLKLLVPLGQEYADGEARLFLRGQLRDETTRAMQEVGAPEGPPEAGAFVKVTLTHRKPGNNIAQNMFAVVYRSPGTWESDPAILQLLNAPQQQAPQYGNQPGYGAPQQAPYQQQAPVQYGQPVQAAPNPQQYAQAQPQYGQAAPQYGQQAYAPNGQPQTAPQYGQAPAGAANAGDPAANPNTPQGQYAGAGGSAEYGAPPAQQYQPAPNPQAPVNQGPAPMQPAAQPQQPAQQQLPINVQPGVQPSGLDPAKQALLARVTGGQQPQAVPQQ